MVDFATGLIDWGDKQAVHAFTAGLVTAGKMTPAQQETVVEASIILVNLGIRLSYEATQKPAAGNDGG